MKPDPAAMKIILRKRENDLQKIIHQMKDDKLHGSTVYHNLEQELTALKIKLTQPLEPR